MGKYETYTCCYCCRRKLEEFEDRKLDCEHYACNGCTYETKACAMVCAVCMEDETE